jgi:hypothetical protein
VDSEIVGRWTLGVGRWALDGGRWTVDGGRCGVEIGEPHSAPQTESRCGFGAFELSRRYDQFAVISALSCHSCSPNVGASRAADLGAGQMRLVRLEHSRHELHELHKLHELHELHEPSFESRWWRTQIALNSSNGCRHDRQYQIDLQAVDPNSLRCSVSVAPQ